MDGNENGGRDGERGKWTGNEVIQKRGEENRGREDGM